MPIQAAAPEEHPAINSILGANPFIDLQPKQLLGTMVESVRFLTARPESLVSQDRTVGNRSGPNRYRHFGNRASIERQTLRRPGVRAKSRSIKPHDADLSRVARLAARPRAGGPEHRLEGCRATPFRHHADYRSARADQLRCSEIPRALKHVFDTAGASLYRGLRNFFDDVISNGACRLK